MSVHLYLYLPETDDEVLNATLTINDFVNEVFNIIRLLKKTNSIVLYYDNENIETFLIKSKLVGKYLNDPKLQLQIGLNKLCAKNIETSSLRKSDCVYCVWNLDEFPLVKYSPVIISEAAEFRFTYPDAKSLIANIFQSILACRERILVFKDAIHIKKYPESFAHIDYVIDSLELEIWLELNNKSNFSLLDKLRFKRTSFIQQGKPVFEEIKTGNFWYIDNFHKNEYEVFDNSKSHIGVANLDGVISAGSAINGRVF